MVKILVVTLVTLPSYLKMIAVLFALPFSRFRSRQLYETFSARPRTICRTARWIRRATW